VPLLLVSLYVRRDGNARARYEHQLRVYLTSLRVVSFVVSVCGLEAYAIGEDLADQRRVGFEASLRDLAAILERFVTFVAEANTFIKMSLQLNVTSFNDLTA